MTGPTYPNTDRTLLRSQTDTQELLFSFKSKLTVHVYKYIFIISMSIFVDIFLRKSAESPTFSPNQRVKDWLWSKHDYVTLGQVTSGAHVSRPFPFFSDVHVCQWILNWVLSEHVIYLSLCRAPHLVIAAIWLLP